MKILNCRETASLGGLFRVIILLAGFFYSSFSFSSVVFLCKGNLAGHYLGYVFNEANYSGYYYISDSCCSPPTSAPDALNICNLYKTGPSSFESSCPTGTVPDANRNCVTPTFQCSDGSSAQNAAYCPWDQDLCPNPNQQYATGNDTDGWFCSKGDCVEGKHWDLASHACVDDIPPTSCPDGSVAYPPATACPEPPMTCWDGSIVTPPDLCPSPPFDKCSHSQKWDYDNQKCVPDPTPAECTGNTIYLWDGSQWICADCPSGTSANGDHSQCLNICTVNCNPEPPPPPPPPPPPSPPPCQSPTSTGCTQPEKQPVPGYPGYEMQTYPDGTTVVTNPDGSTTTYPPGTWTGNPTVPPDGSNPPPNPEPPGGEPPPIPGGNTGKTGYPSGWNDALVDVSDLLCDGRNCMLSYCDKNPASSDCSGYGGVDFRQVKNDYQVSGTCPKPTFNFNGFRGLSSYTMSSHCDILESVRPWVKTIVAILSIFIFVTIILSA